MASATRYDDLARAITESYSRMPNRLQGIARFALGNPDAMALSTVAEIAHEAAVPPSAVDPLRQRTWVSRLHRPATHLPRAARRALGHLPGAHRGDAPHRG